MPTPRRSVRLKKYEAVYKKYASTKEAKPKAVEKTRHVEPKKTKDIKASKPSKDTKASKDKFSKEKKQTLNTYQKFVKEESQKEKYKEMKGSERLTIIAKAWEKHKRKLKKQK